MKSHPAYPGKHTGAVLVVGSAPCFREDMEAALRLRPGAAVMGVNFGGIAIADRLAMFFSLHTELTASFRERLAANGGRGVPVHGADFHYFEKFHPDFAWEGMFRSAGSGWAAAHLAVDGFGFDEAIMCGMPIDTTGYADGIERAGEDYWTTDKGKIVRKYLQHIEHTAPHVAGRVFSMSGNTRDILGLPPQQCAERRNLAS